MKIIARKSYVVAELALLMLVIPAAIVHFHLIRWMLPVLWTVALYCYAIHRATGGEGWRAMWNRRQVTRAVLKPLLVRFALCAAMIAALTVLLAPEKLFSFILERPAFWLMIMFLYPILSALPQEVIFRLFFFRRYAGVFRTQQLMILASGLTFGFAHVIFENWVAPLLCAIGGVLFAMTYARHRSLALVTLEHALFGDFLFTIGLGYYFYHGSVAAVAAVMH